MTDQFKFPEIDEVGIENLDAISFAPRFNHYMYKTISPHCKGEILEIGSGIGNISKHFIEAGSKISLSDIRDNYIGDLKENFPSISDRIYKLDLVDDDFDEKYKNHLNRYDSIFALNVVEHIKEDTLAIKNARKMLKDNGHLIILVPAFQWMYNSFDTALEHYRRYTKRSLMNLMSSHLDIIHHQYFNVFGMLGWFVSGRILRKKTIPRNQMELYDRLIFISKSLDKLVFNKIGLSVIAVGKK
ncbi:MAG: class I SAM-dependent methyltransferase [Saprospiraceae bacterium]|nr:class I SAM-dependent methyltransferase [Bacteroidia bacterium]NNF22931.1 class I SAM-dependent methyltransferase [Saprospiraceae bacterium]NNK89799.1 class I SAM-dependent methyltransferase [Saprospiraceae bacterium]